MPQRRPRVRDPARRGILDRERHPLHRHWSFKYRNGPGYTEDLTNADLFMSGPNRIEIKRRAILLYIGERAGAVSCDLHLPPLPHVRMVVIHQFGIQEPFCYAELYRGRVIVSPGNQLRDNPFKNNSKMPINV